MAQKILVIEDEQVLGEVLFSRLQKEGYETYWETNGESGLKKIRELKPDLVLLDIVMPKKNGYEVLEEKAKDKKIKDIPVIIISNSGQPVEIEKILELGAKDYIVKAQFSPEEVLGKVRRYLSGAAPPLNTPQEGKGRGLSVLIVEDDPFLSSLVKGRLEKEGFAVSVAPDGALALSSMQTGVPDLVLLDIIMPSMNGFDVLKKMKEDPKLKNVSVVIFSNLGQEHEIEQGRQLGADDFLVKAKFTLREVLEKIESLLIKKGKIKA